MPCDAVATIRAEIKNLEKILTPENIRAPIIAYLHNNNHSIIKTNITGDTLWLQTSTIQIAIRGSEITVSGDSKPVNNRMARDLANYLKKLAGALMQRRVLDTLKQRVQVTATTMAPNKVLVIKARV